jgi:hypothetical protein
MNRRLLIPGVLSAILLLPGAAYAQERCDFDLSARTSLLGEARYEVIVLPDSTQTYRLDRISGEVSHLQRSESRFTAMTLAWKALPMPPGEEPQATARVNYQLVLADPGNFPLLMNIHTGATWTLKSAAGDLKWEMVRIEK